jgi:preprotein translocase subunit SecD
MLIAAILFGLLYALPNIYGEDPAVQVSAGRGVEVNNATLKQIEDSLNKEQINIKAISLDRESVLVRFANTDVQIRAREIISETLGERYIVALNLAPATPKWLEAVGAQPMKLGLDLRGGVHFLMEVDVSSALDKLMSQAQESFTASLKEQGIVFSSAKKLDDNVVEIIFPDSSARSRALSYLEPRNRDYAFVNGEGNSVRVMMTDQRIREIKDSSVKQNIETLRSRVNQLGVAEPIVQRQGADRIVIQLPGIQDTARAKDILGATATLEFRMVDTSVDASAAARGFIPGSSEVKYTEKNEPVVLYKRVVLTGDHIIDSRVSRNEMGQTIVSVTLDNAGGRIMADFTQRNLKKLMATLYVEYKDTGKKDSQGKSVLEKQEEVINTATIQSAFGSQFQITGVHPAEADKLSLLLRSGALIAPIHIVEERTIGPSLGQQNIIQGLEACFWGLMVSVIFMLVVYKVFGVFASIALVANVILIVGIMSLLPGATLSMPGIAGIVLTVGMAVDANVLINERIKEELRNGRSVQQAIHEGYNGAFTSILDANLTTLITAAILYWVGTGSVKGFAITLAIGVLTSMFTSIVGTRAIVNLLYGGKRVNKLSI